MAAGIQGPKQSARSYHAMTIFSHSGQPPIRAAAVDPRYPSRLAAVDGDGHLAAARAQQVVDRDA
jgi:hypothetical protein